MRRAHQHSYPTADAEALRQGERFRVLAAAAPGIVWITNAQGEVVEDLPSWRAFTGQSADEITGDGWIAAIHPKDRAHVTAFQSAAMDAGKLCESEFRLRRADGEYRQIMLRVMPVSDADGTIREWVGVGIDTTEHRHCQDKLAVLQAQLTETATAIEQRDRRTLLIDELNAILHACNSLEEAYRQVGRIATRLFPQMNGALALCDHVLQLGTVAQWGSERLMKPNFVVDDCWGLRRGQIHIVDEPGTGTSCQHFTSPPYGTSLCLPLMVHSQTIGLLHFNGGHRIEPDEQQLVARFGEVMKIALADLKLRESLRLQVIRDPLTRLFNRQYLDETLPRECQLATRRKSVLSVAMIDIDHFKLFNDNYGHEAGDCILRELGALMRNAVRSSDIACRYGGEEFVLILLDADLRTAVSRLEQICLDIKSKQCTYRDRTLPGITVSIGVSEFPIHGRSAGEILRAADEALYAAKHAGRDRIVVSAGPPVTGPVPMATIK
jgi:diguanylate cyclase (GGDEF)-like protein/PAS domain S-box-containing protein